MIATKEDMAIFDFVK